MLIRMGRTTGMDVCVVVCRGKHFFATVKDLMTFLLSSFEVSVCVWGCVGVSVSVCLCMCGLVMI